MEIILIGGSGFIGSHLSELLLKDKHEVIVVDINKPRIKDVKYICEDVTEFDGDYFKNHSDVLVYLAANAVAKLCEKYPRNSADVNTGGLIKSLINSGEFNKVIYVSSSFVYGDFQYFPADENHPLNPKGVYASTKLAGELITKSVCDAMGVDWLIIRPSAVYGEYDTNYRVVQTFVENAIKGKTLKLNGNLSLDFTYIDDLVQGINLAINSDISGEIFNITRGIGRSLKELTEIIRTICPNLGVHEGEVDKNVPKRGALDVSKAKDLLGYKPQWDLEAGVQKYYKWMNNNES